ncbi:MAG: hypothetical protein PHQ86_09370, partial [Dehalococcoidales bacterium]|nr:hypothetical protein [Dehalococcoidales bacterium]
MKIDTAKLDGRDLYRLLLSAIVPRPIAFVSTIGEDGIFNLAPYSNFAPMCVKPPVVGFGVGI